MPVVLVVADAMLCAVITTALEQTCAVLAATTQRAALALAKDRATALVILDGNMPGPERAAIVDLVMARNAKARFLLIAPTGGPRPTKVHNVGEILARPIHPGQVVEAAMRQLGSVPASEDPVEELLVRVHRSRTTRFDPSR
jgi:DNA-binding response OmpR family regulator